MADPDIICIEGLDGSGKTSVARALVRLFENAGVAARRIDYSDSLIGRHIQRRSSELAPHVRYLLNAAAFHEAFAKSDAGAQVLIADRYAPSVHAYYEAMRREEQLIPRTILNERTCAVRALLDCPPKLRLARILQRDGKASQRKRATAGPYGARVLRNLKENGPWLIIQSNKLTLAECAESIFEAYSKANVPRRSSRT